MATYYPSLLNTGEPILVNELLAPTPTRTVSPFAGLLSSTGLVPFQRASSALTPRLSPDGRVVIDNTPDDQVATYRRTVVPRKPSLGPPVDAPSFSTDITTSAPGTYGYGPVATATSPTAMDAYASMPSFTDRANTEEDIADMAAQTARDAYYSAQPSLPSLSQITSQPISQTLTQALDYLSTPTSILGGFLSPIAGPFGSMALNAAAAYTNSQLAYDRAMEMQGVPGYSTGQIAGNPYSISPGLLGSQVITGVVPSWFDVTMAENMAGVQAGIDPTTGTDIVGGGFSGPDGGKGVGGYNEQGQFVDAYGQTAATGTMANAEALGAQFGLSLSQALSALSGTRSGKFSSLYDALDAEIADGWGQGFDISTDPDSAALGQASWSEDMTEAAAMAEAAVEAPDWASGFAGWGDSGDGGDGGGGGTHICTAAFKAGISPKERFRANKKYGIKLRREDPVLMRGYDLVGPWIAKKIGHTGAGELLTKIYEKQTTGEKMTLKERILFAILSNTVRPALRAVGALC